MVYTKRLQWFLQVAIEAGFVATNEWTYVELFAGDRSWSKGMTLMGFQGRSWDARYDNTMDFLTPAGFLLMLMSVMKMHVRAVFLAAPPCSSWIFFSRFSTGRWAPESWATCTAHRFVHRTLWWRGWCTSSRSALRGE